MPRRAKGTRRERLIGPARSAALAAMSIGGLSALHLWIGDELPDPARATGDAMAAALLSAEVDRHPADIAMRLRLAREQRALGLYDDAERTLAPFAGEGSAPPREAALLLLDVAVGSWRAAAPSSAGRGAAGARALARIERLLMRADDLDQLARAAGVANELGRPDLAARAHERAAALARDPQQAMALGLQAFDAYRAADRGAEALRLADLLVDRFPSESAVLERAEAAALAQNDSERARRFGARLMSIGAVDAVSLGRQLDLDLAAGDLAAALDAAELLAARAPDDPRGRLTAARVAVWAGRADLALRHWMWLARQRGSSLDGIDQALALARAMQDEGAIAELLTLRARNVPLPSASLAELADALDSSGPPGSAALALERYTASHSESPTAWEGLAKAQERRRDFADALATRIEIGRRFGSSLPNSIHLARLHWAVGRPGDALAELERWSEAGPGDVHYWELLADLAWRQEADAVARRAYGALWEQGRIDAVGAERLLLLSRSAGRSSDLIRFGREGWARLRQPRLLLLAMDEAARAERWADLEQMAEEAAGDGDVFASLPAYWLLRARLDERTGRISEASKAYRRALAADPKSVAARSGLIWLYAGVHERRALAECLEAWAADAWNEPGLWRAYAAGLEELERPREALAFYQREAGTDTGDLARLSLAGSRAARQWNAPAQPATVAAGAEVGAEAVGNILLEQQRAFVRMQVSGAEVEARAGVIRFVPKDAGLSLPGMETRVLVRVVVPALEGRNELAAGISLRADKNVPQVTLARTQPLASVGEARVEASLNEPADESAALRVEATRTRLGGAVAVAEGAAYQRVALDWKSWSMRTGGSLGKGGTGNVEIGWRLRAADPELGVRLQGGYQRNWLASATAPAGLAAFAPGAPVLPDELALLGLGVGVARLPVGPVRLTADAWLGWVAPPVRPAFRVQAGLALAPFRNAELALSAFAANDRWTSAGNAGISLSLTHHFGL